MTDARVAIGMPVLNGANFIRPALDSLLAQTYQDFTILVSDNASTDETVAIVEEYMRRDPRISLQRHPHQHRGAPQLQLAGHRHSW